MSTGAELLAPVAEAVLAEPAPEILVLVCRGMAGHIIVLCTIVVGPRD